MQSPFRPGAATSGASRKQRRAPARRRPFFCQGLARCICSRCIVILIQHEGGFHAQVDRRARSSPLRRHRRLRQVHAAKTADRPSSAIIRSAASTDRGRRAYDVEVRTGRTPSVPAQRRREAARADGRRGQGRQAGDPPAEAARLLHIGLVAAMAAPVRRSPSRSCSGATIAGSGDITVDQVAGDSFEGEVAGSGDLDVGAIEVQSLEARRSPARAASRPARARRRAPNMTSPARATSTPARSSAADAKVSIAGSGSVTAHATGTADVSIMGSGDVDMTGGAKCSVSKARARATSAALNSS